MRLASKYGEYLLCAHLVLFIQLVLRTRVFTMRLQLVVAKRLARHLGYCDLEDDVHVLLVELFLFHF